MRKLILIAAIFTSLHSFAQITFNPGGGINLSRMTTDPQNQAGSARIGFQGGLAMRLGGKFHFQPAIYYTRQGQDMVDTSVITQRNYALDIHGVQVNALIGITFLDLKVFKMRANFGGSANMVLSVDNQAFLSTLRKEDFSSPIYGVRAGLGVDVLFMTLDVGYDVSINPVFKNSTVGSVVYGSGQNQSLYVNLGFKFTVGK